MWSKQQTMTETPAPAAAPSKVPFLAPTPDASRPSISAPRSCARVGSTLQIKGEINGSEDLQIDGIVQGPIFLDGHALTVGSTAQLNSDIHAGDVVVCGKAVGNVAARGRVEITKDGSIVGDISCARISIEDGAHFKGRIEIDPARHKASTI
jgi:cytoskeletal protein CcmA (bactofilin family)